MASNSTTLNDDVEGLLQELVGDGREIGIQVAAYHRGRQVVDAVAGRVAAGGSAADSETIFPIFSVIKGIIAVAAHVQAERGLLDIDAPIASYWPEFGAHGKQGTSLRHVFSHRAGVPHMPDGTTLERAGDWQWMVAAIADLVPLHPPGTQSFYHGMTYGWLIGEAVRRTDPQHRPFEIFLRDEVLTPLGADSLFVSMPDAVRHRVATLSGRAYPPEIPEGTPLRIGIPAAVDLQPEIFNRPDVQRSVIPAVGAYATSDSVARVFAMLAEGGALEGARLLSEERVRGLAAPRPDSDAPDPFLGGPARLSEGGYMLGGARPAVGSRTDTLFSIGAGGSIAWSDRHDRLAVAITHNHMYPGSPVEDDPQVRIGRLIRAGLGIAD